MRRWVRVSAHAGKHSVFNNGFTPPCVRECAGRTEEGSSLLSAERANVWLIMKERERDPNVMKSLSRGTRLQSQSVALKNKKQFPSKPQELCGETSLFFAYTVSSTTAFGYREQIIWAVFKSPLKVFNYRKEELTYRISAKCLILRLIG